jgi:hypothetical protein
MTRTKKLRAFLTLALALILALGSFTTALAAGDGDPVEGSEAAPITAAAFTKILRMPDGTTFPTGKTTFSFTFTKETYEDSNATADLNVMPALTAANITVVDTDPNSLVGDTVSYKHQSANFLNGVTFTKAGVYVYTLAETANTNTLATDGTEAMVYSPVTYTIKIYVKEGSGTGVAVGTYYIAAISAVVTGSADPGQTAEDTDKVDPTPGNGTTDFSAVTFTNTYTYTPGGDNPDPTDPTKSSLQVSMAVAGDYASSTQYFPIEIMLTKPSSVDGAPTYRAYVLLTSTNAYVDLDVDTSVGTKTGDDGINDYIEFTSGAAKTLNLKHDYKLVFVGAPIGTAYVATLAGATGYAPTALVTYDGTASETIGSALPANKGQSLSTAVATVKKLVAENLTGAAFTDTNSGVTPTGILLNNLPYLGLILLALASLVLFVVVKSRRRRNYEN